MAGAQVLMATMQLQEISLHERRAMLTRRSFGYDQHDDHVWRWLNHALRLWSAAHPIRVR